MIKIVFIIEHDLYAPSGEVGNFKIKLQYYLETTFVKINLPNKQFLKYCRRPFYWTPDIIIEKYVN